MDALTIRVVVGRRRKVMAFMVSNGEREISTHLLVAECRVLERRMKQ